MEITREIIERIRHMEATLQTFWGFRHLWAELTANHKQCGVSEKDLMLQQQDNLSLFLGQANILARDLNLTWDKTGCITIRERGEWHAAYIGRRAVILCDGKEIAFFEDFAVAQRVCAWKNGTVPVPHVEEED